KSWRGADFPNAPYAFAFVEAFVKDVVLADVAFRPMAAAASDVVTTFDGELTDPIAAFAFHCAVFERKSQVHLMATGTQRLQEETRPRTARKVRIGFEHRDLAEEPQRTILGTRQTLRDDFFRGFQSVGQFLRIFAPGLRQVWPATDAAANEGSDLLDQIAGL